MLWRLLLLCALSGVSGAADEKATLCCCCCCCCWAAESCPAEELGAINSTRGVVSVGESVPECGAAGEVGDSAAPPLPPPPADKATVAYLWAPLSTSLSISACDAVLFLDAEAAPLAVKFMLLLLLVVVSGAPTAIDTGAASNDDLRASGAVVAPLPSLKLLPAAAVASRVVVVVVIEVLDLGDVPSAIGEANFILVVTLSVWGLLPCDDGVVLRCPLIGTEAEHGPPSDPVAVPPMGVGALLLL